jgi:hypothetical protein
MSKTAKAILYDDDPIVFNPSNISSQNNHSRDASRKTHQRVTIDTAGSIASNLPARGKLHRLCKAPTTQPTMIIEEPPPANNADTIDSEQEMVEEAREESPDPLVQVAINASVTYDSKLPIPPSYREAMRSFYSEYWKVAMQEEVDALHKHGTWN